MKASRVIVSETRLNGNYGVFVNVTNEKGQMTESGVGRFLKLPENCDRETMEQAVRQRVRQELRNLYGISDRLSMIRSICEKLEKEDFPEQEERDHGEHDGCCG